MYAVPVTEFDDPNIDFDAVGLGECFPSLLAHPDYAFASLRPQAELCQVGGARWRFEWLTESASFRDRAFKAYIMAVHSAELAVSAALLDHI